MVAPLPDEEVEEAEDAEEAEEESISPVPTLAPVPVEGRTTAPVSVAIDALSALGAEEETEDAEESSSFAEATEDKEELSVELALNENEEVDEELSMVEPEEDFGSWDSRIPATEFSLSWLISFCRLIFSCSRSRRSFVSEEEDSSEEIFETSEENVIELSDTAEELSSLTDAVTEEELSSLEPVSDTLTVSSVLSMMFCSTLPVRRKARRFACGAVSITMTVPRIVRMSRR